jgi:UDP-N-acetylmuramate dehydrogenase
VEIEHFKGELLANEPLSRHTSFRIGGPVDLLAYPADREDLHALLAEIKKKGLRYFVLGGGTNVLAADSGFRGVVIGMKRMAAVRIEREYRSIGGAFAAVFAEAGVPLPALCLFASEHALTGLEFAAGIPGTVGGAVCMNAGASGGELGDVIESVTLLTPDGELTARNREELEFGYRTAQIPAGHLVVDARVVLRRGNTEQIKERVRDLLAARKQRQPLGFPSAGSVFKNPLEASAGRLIETAKLKGKTIGGAQVSDKHANFIVNLGTATARDVQALMAFVQQTVLDVHGVRLEPEIKILGDE